MSLLLKPSFENAADARRALLEARLRNALAESGAVPLSFAQDRLWFLDQLEPDSALYNVPAALRMTGMLNVAALQTALDGLVARHEILRTRFVGAEGNPSQIVEDEARVEIVARDLRSLPGPQRDREARKLLREEVNRPFDLSARPPVRALLLRLDADEHCFVLTLHHIVADEWSLRICFRELGEFYDAACCGRTPALPELPIQYADYALWQRQWLEGEIFERQLTYWQRQLGGNPPVLELPADRPRPALPTFCGGSESLRLAGDTSSALKALADGHDSTVFMVLLAAFKALLHRYTQQDDLVVGSPIAGRTQVETEPLIGFFVNTLMLRTDASGNPTFTELLRRVREVTLGACAHQDLPFEKLVERLRPERTLNHMPFTRVMFTVQRDLFDEIHWPGLTLRPIELESETAKFDFTLVAQETAGGLCLRAEYNRDRFAAASVARLLRHFESLLRGIVAAPERRLSDLPLLTEPERQQLLAEWRGSRTRYPRHRCVHQLFEAQVERAPNAIALVFENETITYRELNARANQLARHLRKFPVGPDVPVAVCAERSPEMIVAALAVLKAGGAYVPLDPTYPKERLAFMLSDTHAPVVLTRQRLLPRLPQKIAGVICLDSDWELIAREERENLPVTVTPGNLAYVMYTSGSTGQPKGVAVPHRAINRLVLNMNYIRFTAGDRVAHVSNASFDAATFEIWGALLNGARLVGITEEVLLSPKDFARELRQQEITALFLTCSLFNQIASEAPGAFATVRTVMFGGEAADPKSVRSVLEHEPPQRLVNGYGPTENTTFSACCEVRDLPADATTVPIGRPVSNTQCYVLDRYLNPVPIGVPGELYVGGDGLARGYWNRPELTAQKFVPNPFAAVSGRETGAARPDDCDSRLYKTGDLVRWRPDGNLEFLGRLDHQVKIRGFRVELGEIEAALSRHPAIRECVVTAHESKTGHKQLAAHFVAGGRRAPTASELRRFLQQNLPEYMVPSAFVELESLPLTPNGKVDRRALPEPGKGRPKLEKGYATPRDAVEVKLTEIWENVLGIHPIGIEDKFFDLGGHSLLAVRLIAQIEKAFSRKLRLATIFQAQTIEQLAAIIREEIREGTALAGTSLVEIHSEGSKPPIFFAHGAGGGMFWGYVNLSRHLGADQPVYGLKSRGLDGREEFDNLEEMAAQYVADLRAVQARGPYRLGGYCFGGNVAFEMARQLQAQGEEVAVLALLNCVPANSSYARIRFTPAWALRFLKNLFYWFGYYRGWSSSQRREFYHWKRETFQRRLGRLFRNSAEPIATVDAGNLVDLSSYSAEQRKLWETHIHALARYRPKPYPGRVHLFRSPGHPLLCSFAPDYGWRELARGGVEISIVPGVHEKILEEPCVQVVAAELNKMLNESASGESRGTTASAADQSARVKQASCRSEADRPEACPTLEFWKCQIQGAPALLDLPADRPRPAALSSATAREPVLFSREFTEALEDFGCAENCPLFVTLLAAFQSLLARYTGNTDIIVGSIQNGKKIALRGDLSGDPAFRELLRRLRQVTLDAAPHAAWPLEEHLEEIGASINASYAPVFQVMLVVDGDSAALAGETLTGLRGAVLDLALRLSRTPEGLSGWIEYSTALFDAPRISRMVEHFGTLLEEAVLNPAEAISVLPLLPEPEARQVLIEWNATAKKFSDHLTLAQLFEAQVVRTPDVLALVSGRERFTYRELNARANQLAHHLRSLGVAPETLVGICLERSWRLMVAILGVLKAGGAYVPLDPAYPKDRLAFILDDARAPVLLTQSSLSAVHARAGTHTVCLDSDWNRIASNCADNPFSGAEPADLAYVIYTSGSTGRPKGVALTHRNAVALMCWAKDVFRPEEIAGVLASTSICFDLSVFEMFVPLSWGGAVVLADNALALPGLPARDDVTLINTVPSAIRELVRLKAVPSSVRVINLAGEPLATPLVDAIYAGTNVQKVYDLYGPSETTTYSTFTLRRPGEPATIGRPLANEQVFLLDRNRQPVPMGLPGEIYIGGAGVGRGYLNLPELTAEKFLTVAQLPGLQRYLVAENAMPLSDRLYRTGDLARWRADGQLEFLGRMDHQVKIRGFRIELGEIESVLRKHPAVREAIVLARKVQPGDKRLAAYVVAKNGQAVSADELRRFAKRTLPDYMLPPAFVFLEAIPLTPNGKVDRKALPAPPTDRADAGAEFVAPGSEVEKALADIWCEVLGLKHAGVHDNFFELGGHSLLAMQVLSRIRERFKLEAPLSALFDLPTIAALAREIESGKWAGEGSAALQAAPRDGKIPASFVQEQLWFFEQMQPGTHAYNMPIAFRLHGRLDRDALQGALDQIVRRHEALRTTFAYVDGGVTQIIAATVSLPIRFVDLQGAEGREEKFRDIANSAATEPFDLERGPLLRVMPIRLHETDHALIVVAHHAVFDGWSWAVFFEELGVFYDALVAGRAAPALPDLPAQYADFAAWRRQEMSGAALERELAYWREHLRDAPPVLDLPTDRPEPEKLSDQADERTIMLSPALSDALVALGRREGSSLFMELIAALTIVFQKWTQQKDMVIGTVVAGRTRRELEPVIGCFMNFLPIRTRIAGDETARALLAKVRQNVLDAQSHQACPFEKIVEAVNPERRLNRNPVYNVALLLQNFPEQLLRTGTFRAVPMRIEARAPLVDLRFEAVQRREGLSLLCEFNTDLFDAGTVEEFLSSCSAVLEAFVQNPDVKVSELDISAALSAQARRARARRSDQTIAVAATFTAEPVAESLRYWMKELGIPAKIEFAPFNQVFQQLLDPQSLFGANERGLNVVLARPEDWLKSGRDDGGAGGAEGVERTFNEFVSAVKSAASRSSAPFLVLFCPASAAIAADGRRRELLDRAETVAAGQLENVSGVCVVTSRELQELYPVADYYDASGDELGRVPYTPVFFTALGTMIARKFHARLRPGPKVIVLDCDQTLWAGVCGEDGASGICLDAPRRALQNFMRAQHAVGRLLAICSKNNEEDVRDVFAQRLDLPLRREHFAAWRANWRPKSENLRSIAEELNLGLDSFIFVDDNPVECAEVEANCPDVLTLQLPEDPARIPMFLKHCWVFDQLKLTTEDRARGERYRQNQQREQTRAQSASLADFLAGLELKIRIAPMSPDQLPRVAQLTQRTNQFNCTTIRRAEADLRKLSADTTVLALSVSDRFGDYGLVGAAICEPHGASLDVETFLLSCRVLGRGVEHELLAHLGKLALDEKLRWVDVHFHPSPKNKPAADFLQSVGAAFRQALNGGFVYRFPAEFAAEVVFAPRDESGSRREEALSGNSDEPSTQSERERSLLTSAATKQVQKFGRCRAIALEAHDAARIHQAIESTIALRSSRHSGSVAPRTEMEREICALWARLLHLERVGINENFFDLGGHSLLAVRLFAELEKLTGRKLPLVTIFQAPTIEQLMRELGEGQSARSRSPLFPIQPNGSRPPLFLVHGAGGDILWGYANLAMNLPPDQPIYGIKSRGQIGLEEYDRIEDMARYYLEEVRALQPEGPYYLGGYCFGGNVAYEMARQLHAQGQGVALLALMDASPSNAGYERMAWWRPGFAFRFARNLSYWLRDFAGLKPLEQRRYLARKARVLVRKLVRKGFRRRTAGDVDLEEVIELSHFPERELKFWQIHLRAIEQHFEQPYAGHVTLIRTRGQPLFCSLSDDFCWGKLARGGVTVKRIPGSHENIFMEPNVRSLAQQMEACLAEARAAAAAVAKENLVS